MRYHHEWSFFTEVLVSYILSRLLGPYFFASPTFLSQALLFGIFSFFLLGFYCYQQSSLLPSSMVQLSSLLLECLVRR